MARLIFVNRFFFPDHSATSQILSDLTFHLAAGGRDIHVVTSTQTYTDPKTSLPARETINGVHVHRVAATKFGRDGLVGRALDYSSFYASAFQMLLKIAEPNDAIIAETDPPLVSVPALHAARRRRARLVNWLQDIYPETAAALGVPLLGGSVGRTLALLRNRSLRQAQATVVVGELMARRVEALGAPVKRVHVIPNWCNDDTIKSLEPAGNPLRAAWRLQAKFVVSYSGNLGWAHDYETVLEAADRLRNNSRILFLMIGGGKRFEELQRAVKARGLEDLFRFMPYQDQSVLPHSLAVADVHWLSLYPQLEGLIVPSKFYGMAATGRPIVMIGDPNGELGMLIQRHDCGAVITPGEWSALAATLERWLGDPSIVAGMGARARQMLQDHFSRRQALSRWIDLCDQLHRESVRF